MNRLARLRLLQLADSALPIGSTAHSFGLETLVTDELLAPPLLEEFLDDYFAEMGRVEAVFCRAAYQLVAEPDDERFAESWLALNQRLSALKAPRESREASAVLGRRFLRLVAGLEPAQRLQDALRYAQQQESAIHHSTAFGLAAGILGVDETEAVLALLQQMAAGLVSACQRLMPVGQSFAAHLIWRLHPTLITVAEASMIERPFTVSAFSPLIDLASMRHPRLPVRLFIS
jgi:urease accessory protein